LTTKFQHGRHTQVSLHKLPGMATWLAMEPRPVQLRVLVVGLGALGGVVAHVLSAADCEITALVRRSEIEQAVNTSGLRELRSGTLSRPLVVSAVEALAGTFEYVVLATQPTDVDAAIDSLLGLLNSRTQIVCLQNGLCEERVAAKLGRERVIGAVVTFGAKSHGIGVCEHVPGGGLVLGRIDGSVDDALTQLAERLKGLGKTRISHNLMGIRWSKLIVNCAISTLGTIGGDQLGALLNKAYVRELAFEVMGEAVNVARASSIRLERLPGTLPLQWLTASGDASAGLKAAARSFAQHTAAIGLGAKYRRLRSSMLRAIERGHAPAVDFLNGEVVARGRELGVKTPINERARELVWAISRGERAAAHETLRAFYDETRAGSPLA
jgi:2-dehydropantoate 2-reductase